jgi:hypothetical protein
MLFRLQKGILEHETLFTIGVFGLAQMAADLMVDFNVPYLPAAIRFVGVLVVVLVLWTRVKNRQTEVSVPLVFAEDESRELVQEKFDRFVEATRLHKAVKELDVLAKLNRNELHIRLAPNVRETTDRSSWQGNFRQLLREWEKEVDERVRRWLPGRYRGVVYHVRPNVVLPMAFALGYSVGLRRAVILYHASGSQTYRVMDLTYPRTLFERPQPPIPLKQEPENLSPPEQRGDRLILHIVVSERHRPTLEAHPDHAQATSVAIYHDQTLPQSDWLPYAQAIWQKAQPWVNAFQQVDICLACPDALAFALGMAFARMSTFRVCHWINSQYMPVLDLKEVDSHPPFD